MKKNMPGKRILALFLALFMMFGFMPTGAFAIDAVTVKIIGENGVIKVKSLALSDVTDYTTDASDHSTSKNALDAVLSATQLESLGTYSISYSASYYSYSINRIAGITPSGGDYWGSLAVSSSGSYDGNALSTHALAAGDTYIVYYDKYIGGSANYGYQYYAWFNSDTVSGSTGSPVSVEVKTTGYDTSWNTVALPLKYATVYASGGSYSIPTAVGVTDADGKAQIYFADAGTYTLSLSNKYTFAQCSATVTGSGAPLSNLKVDIFDASNHLSGAQLTLKSGSSTYSAYSISSAATLYLLGSVGSTYTTGPATYLYLLPDGAYDYSVTADGYIPKSGSLTVSGTTNFGITMCAMSGYAVSITLGDPGETVSVKDANGNLKTPLSSTSGVYTYDLVNGNYTYTVSRSGYHSLFGNFTVNGAAKNITTATLTDSAAATAEWPAFRSFGSGMAISNSETPKGSWQASEKWAASLGSLGSYGSLTTSNLVIYDGYIYTATEHGLAKIFKSSGTLLTTTALSKDPSYAPYIAYGDGKVFVTNSEGIDAFDALTMERIWFAPISIYGKYMAETPILYNGANNTIYVGDYGDSSYTMGTYGGYCAINASTGAESWIMYGGATDAHYWAGAVIAENYLVFGSDSEKLSSVSTSSSGYASAAGTLSVNGQIKSSVVYDGTYLYFTTKSGYIYKASIDSSTGALTLVASRQFTSAGSVSTPVIYNGRVYVGGNDKKIYVLNSSDFNEIASFTTEGAVQSSALLTTAYSGEVYAYFTVNSARGEIYAVRDNSITVTCEKLYTPSHEQYSYTSIISDSEGTLYYSNDSGYVSAITNTNADKTGKAKVSFNVTPSSVFDSGTYATTYPSVCVKNSGSTVQTTSASGIYYLSEGAYTYTVSLTGYTTSSGSFTVASGEVSNVLNLDVTLTKYTPPDPTITAYVTVTGHKDASILSRRAITLDSGASAWSAIKKALVAGNISYETKDTAFGLYIWKINGLSEHDYGGNSGWEYKVNGEKPKINVESFALSGGDEILVYYTEDYTQESDYSPAWTSGGSATADIDATLNKDTGIAATTLSSTALTSFNKALEAASDAEGDEASITIKTPSGSNGVSLTLPNSTLSALAGKINIALSIKTGIGSMSLSAEALDKIYSAAGSGDATLTIAKADASKLSDENRSLIGSHPVYDLSVTANGKGVTSFGGRVTVTIPYTPVSSEDTSNLKIYYIAASGKAVEMQGAYYDKDSGSILFTTDHFSKFAVINEAILSFADVSPSDWYYNSVKYISKYRLMGGSSDTAFEPNSEMTRAMLVTVLYRLAGKPFVNSAITFPDVEADEWYTDAVKWASASGIVKGYETGLFGTNDSITREQLAVILQNYAKYKGFDVSKSMELTAYADASSISSWALNAMKWATAEGLINGVTADSLSPSGTATRAQVATILMRFNGSMSN